MTDAEIRQRLYIPDDYRLKDVEKDKISVGIILPTDVKEIERISAVTQRYKMKGYLHDVPYVRYKDDAVSLISLGIDGMKNFLEELDPDLWNRFIDNGCIFVLDNGIELYIDKYEWSSFSVVALKENKIVGSLRMIIGTENGDVPAFDHGYVHMSVSEVNNGNGQTFPAELSQLVITRDANVPFDMIFGLIRNAYRYSKEILGLSTWIAVLDNKVKRYLETRTGLEFVGIGDTIFHLGSYCTPIKINLEASLEYMRQKGKEYIVNFIAGDLIPVDSSFAWYVGR